MKKVAQSLAYSKCSVVDAITMVTTWPPNCIYFPTVFPQLPPHFPTSMSFLILFPLGKVGLLLTPTHSTQVRIPPILSDTAGTRQASYPPPAFLFLCESVLLLISMSEGPVFSASSMGTPGEQGVLLCLLLYALHLEQHDLLGSCIVLESTTLPTRQCAL